MRKKFLALVLGLVVALSAMMFTACGSTIFDGDYTEVTKQDLATFAAEVAESTEIDYNTGVKIVYEADIVLGDAESTVTTKVKSEGVTAKVDEKTQMKASVELSMSNTADASVTTDIKADAYYNDGFVYANAVSTIAGVETSAKVKAQETMENFIEDNMQVSTDIADLLEEIEEYELMGITGIKIYMDRGEEYTKVKVEVPEQTFTYAPMPGYSISGSTKMEIVFVYNAQKQLVAFRMVSDSQGSTTAGGATMNTTQKLNCTIEPYSGSIELPSDLDTYTLGELPW